MTTELELREKIESLAVECHTLACSLDVGPKRSEMFELYGVLRNLNRRGYAERAGREMNPLMSHNQHDEDDDWEWGEDEDE